MKIGDFFQIKFAPITEVPVYFPRYPLRIVTRFSNTGSPIFYFLNQQNASSFLQKDYLLVKTYTYSNNKQSLLFINEDGIIIEIKVDTLYDFRINSGFFFKYEKLLTHPDKIVRDFIREFHNNQEGR